MMKRFLMLLGIVVALAAAVSAQAATTVQKQPFAASFTICNGDTVEVAGTLLLTQSATSTPSGGQLYAIHGQWQEVSGVDTTTGTVFRLVGTSRDMTVFLPNGGFTSTFVDRFNLQATRGAESYIVPFLNHIVVAPDGTVQVFFDKFSAPC